MRMLYFECISGISGDMAVAAMLDLGADEAGLRRVLGTLNLDGYRIEITDVEKSGVRARDFNVILEHDNHDHDSEYLYGKGATEHHHGHHRTYPEIVNIVEGCDLSPKAMEVAKRIFSVLAEAEAEAHGVPMEKVHFHEVGAVDSIVDVVSLAFCIDDLGIESICFSNLYDGTGMIRCQHGLIPVPVPAVVNIVKKHGIRLTVTDSKGEYVTPTGAAFVASVVNSELPGSFKIESVGVGAGKRESERSGLLRAMIIHPTETEQAVKLECNVDDCTGEALGFAMERLYAAGAREVNYTPVFMKKNRPGWLLTAICRESERERLEGVMFRETTTIGIRRMRIERTRMERESITVDTEYGPVSVKMCSIDGLTRYYPEFEDVARICRDRNIPFREVYEAVVKASSDLRRRVQAHLDESSHPAFEVRFLDLQACHLHGFDHNRVGVASSREARAVVVDRHLQIESILLGYIQHRSYPGREFVGEVAKHLLELSQAIDRHIRLHDRDEHSSESEVAHVPACGGHPCIGDLLLAHRIL